MIVDKLKAIPETKKSSAAIVLLFTALFIFKCDSQNVYFKLCGMTFSGRFGFDNFFSDIQWTCRYSIPEDDFQIFVLFHFHNL